MEPDVTFADAGMAADALHERCGGGKHWYVGIATRPHARLATLHRVDLVRGSYGFVRCTNVGVAMAAARLLRSERGYQGAPGAGDPQCVFVYAYAITEWTWEPE